MTLSASYYYPTMNKAVLPFPGGVTLKSEAAIVTNTAGHLILSSSGTSSIIRLSGNLHTGGSSGNQVNTNRPITLGSSQQIGDDLYGASYISFDAGGADTTLHAQSNVRFYAGSAQLYIDGNAKLTSQGNHLILSPTLGVITLSASVYMPNLPTADPGNSGQLYVTAGAIMISA